MTDRKKDLLYLAGLLAVLLLVFSKILFTAKIIRAPDITNEFFWTIRNFKEQSFLDLFRVNLRAGWDMLANGGTSEGGGTLSLQLLFYRNLIFWLLPEPANIAWFIVLHLFFGAAGTYLFCRAIGTGRKAAFLAGLIFALAPENASLINAGHVQKIATISFAPWAFYFFEKGFQSRRTIFFLTTGLVLAFQFFNMHWQIAYYTCLGIALYSAIRLAAIYREERRDGRKVVALLGMNAVTVVFFLTTVAISLLPLANWSRDTNRGVASGANDGRGGLNVEEAMSWSLPPEETVTFFIPGFFGLSRQEGAYNTTDIDAYYWGRMFFTQTTDYMGLLPWLLLPLPFLFRRNRYTWIGVAAVVGGILFSMGRYTPFYWFLYNHFPGINHFRVPKMMMFLTTLGLAVLAAQGLDLLFDGEMQKKPRFRFYILSVALLPLLLLLLLGIEVVGKSSWLDLLYGLIDQPTRFEQGFQLVSGRWNNLVKETAIAAGVAAAYGAVFIALHKKKTWAVIIPPIVILLFLLDTGRINNKFMILQDMPAQYRAPKTPAIDFLFGKDKQYRVLPMNNSDPMQYVSNGIPVMFTSNPVQQRRWQEFLDNFSLASSMPDIINVKYLIYPPQQFAQDKAGLGDRYVPVFQNPGGNELILENRAVMPKGWLVPSAIVVSDVQQRMAILQNPAFDPRKVAIVESTPTLPLNSPLVASAPPGNVETKNFESNKIELHATVIQNSMLVIGEKYYQGWNAFVDGKRVEIYPVDHILRGVYLAPGEHTVKFIFDPLPFKIGKYVTLASFLFFVAMLVRELLVRREKKLVEAQCEG